MLENKKVKLYCYAVPNHWGDGYDIQVSSFELRTNDYNTYIPIGEQEITVKLPNAGDLTLCHIGELEGLMFAKTAFLREKIDNLKALPPASR